MKAEPVNQRAETSRAIAKESSGLKGLSFPAVPVLQNRALIQTRPTEEEVPIQGQFAVAQLIGADGSSGGSVEHQGLLANTGTTRIGGANVQMTYHHVIPRNKLSTFWSRVVTNRQVKHLVSGLTTAVDNAYERGGATATAFQDNNGTEITKKQVTKLIGDLGKKTRTNQAINLSADEQARGDLLERIFQWMPGNIHRGPSLRMSITAQGADPERDDGGDQFEVSAKHVIPEDKYTDLKSMDALIDKYIADNKAEHLIKISPLVQAISGQTSPYPYHPDNWTFSREYNVYRIVPH